MSTSGRIVKRTARGRFASSRTSSRAPAGRKLSPAIMPPQIETAESTPAPQDETAKDTPLASSPRTAMLKQVLAASGPSASTANGKEPQRQDHLDELTRQIYDAFSRAESAFTALKQQQEQQGEDIEMINAVAIESYHKLSDDISDFRAEITNKETVDQQQKEWLLDECRQFGATVETETMRLQQDIEGVKGYVDTAIKEFRAFVTAKMHILDIIEGSINKCARVIHQLERRMHNLDDTNTDHSGEVPDLRNELGRANRRIRRLEASRHQEKPVGAGLYPVRSSAVFPLKPLTCVRIFLPLEYAENLAYLLRRTSPHIRSTIYIGPSSQHLSWNFIRSLPQAPDAIAEDETSLRWEPTVEEEAETTFHERREQLQDPGHDFGRPIQTEQSHLVPPAQQLAQAQPPAAAPAPPPQLTQLAHRRPDPPVLSWTQIRTT